MGNNEMLGAMVGALIVVGGGVLTLLKVMAVLRKEKEEESEKILHEAKTYTDNQCKLLKSELDHHKEMHEGKVAELARKIEDLRDELRMQHSQLVSLLTKMLDKKD